MIATIAAPQEGYPLEELILRRERRQGIEFAQCKEHNSGDNWFALPEQWLAHLRTEHLEKLSLYQNTIGEKGLREATLETFKRLTGESKEPVEDKAFFEEMENLGRFTRERVEKVLHDMIISGIIFEVRAHFYKKA